MIFPRPSQRLFAAAVLALCCIGEAAALDLADLMATLARSTHGAATFKEKKYLAILDAPVESSGELLFVPPARLEKLTLKPSRERLVLDGDVLTVERGRRTHVLALKDYPEVAGMIESIRATLAGDRDALERVYHLSVSGSRARWSLALVPLDARIGRVVARIRIDGAGGDVRTVEILQADGDRSVMTVEKAGAP
ncbi:MAG: LolA-related protein [Thiobacillus sp.]